jgi:hypothetical protein
MAANEVADFVEVAGAKAAAVPAIATVAATKDFMVKAYTQQDERDEEDRISRSRIQFAERREG